MPPLHGSPRLSREQRRRQLISVGLELLVGTPFSKLSVDEVAATAGISRSLLFHYFPSKQEYLAAVVEAAASHVLALTMPPPNARSTDQIHAMVSALVKFIQRRRENYIAIIRSASGIDAQLSRCIDEMHLTLSLRFLSAVGIDEPGPGALLAVRGWLSMLEELAVLSTDGPIVQDRVIDYITERFITGAADPSIMTLDS